ncbi:AfsA-related hotdog domain-containing protein [Enterococcus quebecensis]|uniref:A-factor biosynthesis hotdog domain-containing protein n=1 Tax=Enterococcus quebecensis TaxID=903983 RepID=A0A1E5GTI0_9ENTE|nr:AfsA-related hotdog domain-containing protein [Enterococcus quebecensis]OEG15959.1 hypothetical protein BCR23_07365 [Enterococcus quebecensis]OJG74931.1 hypothetical protein RV12_GL001976 [Enterococcus quebecensis]
MASNMVTESQTTVPKFTLVYTDEKTEDVQLGANEIPFHSIRELELLKISLGETVSNISIRGMESSNLLNARDFKWDYRNPLEMFDISKKIPMPDFVEEKLFDEEQRIDKKFVHKQNAENVLLSKPINYGNVWYFKGFSNIAELNSDHLSDHVDGIKLFEAFRQATLASFHLNGMNFDGVVALTNFKIDYINYVELDEPYIIQTIPACESDGGAMYCIFNIFQGGKIVTSGFLGAYTFRSKEIYHEKRNK